jgi:hypothetical protein
MTMSRGCALFCKKASLNAEIAEDAECAEKEGGWRFARRTLGRFLFSVISALSAISALRLATAAVSTGLPDDAKLRGQRA